MEHTTSADGTTIAFERSGDGPALVIVNGAFSTAADVAEHARALAEVGVQAVRYDRRARGGSGDAEPRLPEREAEDLAAVIDAVGGRAAVLGHSSGAVLALYAASLGVPIERLLLSEPPFDFDGHDPENDLDERLQELVSAGRLEDAVVLFQREGVGLPEEMIEQIRQSPWFAGLLPLAQSTVYDARLVRAVGAPTAAMLGVSAPVSVLCGIRTFPDLEAAARRLAEEIPQAELVILPRSTGHRLDPAETAEIVSARWSSERRPFLADAARWS